jgi:UDP-glucose 4-epimerase
VTGGAGFIGSHLCDRIIEEEPSRLIVVDDFSLGKERNVKLLSGKRNARIYRTDAADYPTMDKILERERIEIVFDLAVIPLPKSLELPMETVETNVKLTTTLCELLRKKKFKTLVHCSSSEAYGNALHVPMDESHPQLPLTPYAASKIAGDHIAISYNRAFDLDIAIARPFNTYGPRQNELSYAGVIPRTIMRMM